MSSPVRTTQFLRFGSSQITLTVFCLWTTRLYQTSSHREYHTERRVGVLHHDHIIHMPPPTSLKYYPDARCVVYTGTWYAFILLPAAWFADCSRLPFGMYRHPAFCITRYVSYPGTLLLYSYQVPAYAKICVILGMSLLQMGS